MAGNARWLYTNLVQAAVSVLSASSFEVSFPLAYLLDPLRSAVWRSRLGWNIVVGFNDKLDFIDGGAARVATLTAGNYQTGVLMATHLTTQINAVAVTNTYLVTYDTATAKFTFARATGAGTFGIELSAPNAASVATDLGLTNPATDKTGSTSYLADLAAYHSREFLKVDLGSALACQAGIVINHNAGAGGTFTHQGNATDAWAAPTINQTLAGNADIRIAFFGSSSQRWWRLLISDVQNSAGYSEVGIWFSGPYTTPSVNYSIDHGYEFQELSSQEFAPGGAGFQDRRARRQAWKLSWIDLQDADRLILEAVGVACPAGTCLFFAFDGLNSPLGTQYVYLAANMSVDLSDSSIYWNVSVPIAQALG